MLKDLKIEIVNPIRFPAWEGQMANLQGSTFFYSSNWAQVLCQSYGYRPRYFCTFYGDQISNLIPVMEIQSSITGKRGVSLPFSDQVEPLVEDAATFKAMLSEIIAFGRKKGWKTLDFHGGKEFLDINDSCRSYIAHRIELYCSPPDLIKGFRNSTRRNIQKSKKMGVRAKISMSPDSMAEFSRLNYLTRRLHGLPPQPDYFFHNVYKNILAKGRGFTCLAIYNDIVIAGVVFFITDNEAIYKYGASDKRFLHLRPNNLVMAEAIQWAAEHGIKTIDLGRTEIENEGQLQFKKGWSADTTDLYYYKIEIPTGRLLKNRMRLRSSYAIFKMLPIPILKKVGNIAYRHIG